MPPVSPFPLPLSPSSLLPSVSLPGSLIHNRNISDSAKITWAHLRGLAGEADHTPPLTYRQVAEMIGKSVSALYSYLHQLRGFGMLETRRLEDGRFVVSFAILASQSHSSCSSPLPSGEPPVPFPLSPDPFSPLLPSPPSPLSPDPSSPLPPVRDGMNPDSWDQDLCLPSAELPHVTFPLTLSPSSPHTPTPYAPHHLAPVSPPPDSRNPVSLSPESRISDSALTLYTSIQRYILKHYGIGIRDVKIGINDVNVGISDVKIGENPDFWIPKIGTPESRTRPPP